MTCAFQVLEEDAARLANEVDASEFGTLEEKASAKAIASRLREEAKRVRVLLLLLCFDVLIQMEQISMGVESDEFQREIRDASHNVDAAAEKVVENKGFEQIKGKVEQVHDDARVLNTAVGKGDLEEEQLAAKKVQDDIDTLEKGAVVGVFFCLLWLMVVFSCRVHGKGDCQQSKADCR